VIYLEITAAVGVRRTGNTVRPLLAGPDRADRYRALMADRVPLYRRIATMRVNTNRRNPGTVVRHIVSRLQNPQPEAPRTRRRPSWRRRPDRLPPTPATGEPRRD
jgi:shikimate kinase